MKSQNRYLYSNMSFYTSAIKFEVSIKQRLQISYTEINYNIDISQNLNS